MMKRDELVREVMRGIFEDAARTFPSDSVSLHRDLTRVEENIESLGHYFYAHELPRVGQAFRRALETGNTAPLRGECHMSMRRGHSRPTFLGSLFAGVFDDGGYIRPYPDVVSIKFLQQIFFCFKKIEGACDENADAQAIDGFTTLEGSLPEPTLRWNYGDFDTSVRLGLDRPQPTSGIPSADGVLPPIGSNIIDARLPKRAQLIADIVFGSFPGFNPEEWRCSHGPGAVADARRGAWKYLFPFWPNRLDALFCYDAHATIGGEIFPFENVEHPAKLITVPKDSRGPRLIASEPTALQFAQQSLNAYLRDSVKNSCISASIRFSDQSYSQERALEGSLTGEYATVDLKSASDKLTLWAIERMVSSNTTLLNAIYATRSRVYSGPNGESAFLKKVAPQGNAFIFPLQTIFYTIVAIAALSVIDGVEVRGRRDIKRLSTQVRVFGDDIILPTRAYGMLVSLLTFLGLEVNVQKSFSEGNFREACGVDAFAGYNVTPAYVKTIPVVCTPETITASVEAHNNLYDKGYYAAARRLRKLIPREKLIPEVTTSSGAFGFRAANPDNSSMRTRYNRALQRVEVYTVQAKAKIVKTPAEGIRCLLQFVTESPDPLNKEWTSGTRVAVAQNLRAMWVPVDNLR